jgi:hypothetical protein
MKAEGRGEGNEKIAFFVHSELMDLGDQAQGLESSEGEVVGMEDILQTLERLSPEQVSLCQYRHMLLCYLDRLSTYEVRSRPSISQSREWYLTGDLARTYVY